VAFSEFRYLDSDDGHSMLTWYTTPPYGRMFYDFKDKSWNFMD
jgi:hypothetical protein